MSKHTFTNRAVACLLLGSAVLLTSCGPFIGWTVNAFAPPQKVDATYEPPKDKTFLVFVDDMVHPVFYEPVKGELAEKLNRQLVDKGVAAKTIPYSKVLALASATPGFNRLSVSEVGEKLGADIVLYVIVDKFSLKDNEATPLWQGRLSTTVRLVAVGIDRLWPEDRLEGYPVEPLEMSPETHPSPTYGEVLSKKLAEKMADRIAKLFYDHEISPAEARERKKEQA